MARLPNRKLNIGTGAAPAAPAPEADRPTAFDDSLAAGFLATMKRGMEVELQGWRERPADWNPLDHIPKGYEQQAEFFAVADGPDQIPIIQRQIDEARARDARRAERGLSATLTNDLLVEATNPLNYLPGGRAVGVGTVRGALNVGASNVAIGALDEGLRAGADVTYTFDPANTALNVGTNAAFGAALGGAIGRVTSPRPTLVSGGQRATRAPLPVKGFRVGSRFGRREAPVTRRGKGSSNHQGVDIPAPRGTKVEPQLGGKVVAITTADSKHPNGNSVTIDHGGGVVTKYLHLDSMDVRVGSTVTPGMRIGRVGSTGNSSGNHLHYQMEIGGKAVDPLTTKLPEGVGHDFATPAQAVDSLAGVDVPDVLDFDGRSIPIVIGNTGTGAIAAMRRSRPVGEIVDELSGIDVGRERVVANDTVPDPDAIDFDRLIPPEDRFGSSGAPWSKSLLLDQFDDRLKEAEKAARRGATDHDPEWLVRQRALVEAAYGEPDIPHIPSEAERVQQRRRAEAAGDPRRHDPNLVAERTAGEASPTNAAIQSKRFLARAEGLRAWAEDALGRHGTDAAELDKKGKPYSKAFLQSSLKAAMKDIQAAEAMLDEVTYSDGNWSVNEFGDATWSPTDRTPIAAERGPLDEGLAEIREQDRIKRGNDLSSGELDDNLPFGRAHVGEAGVTMNGDHIVFDLGAAIRAYSHRPWTQSHVDGVEPLPADAFPTLKSWLDFVVRHELVHAFEQRIDGETVADYENRVVRRTIESLKAEQASARPEGNWAQLQSLRGTPIKDVMDLVEDGEAAIFESVMRLASDGATFLERSVLGGSVTPNGGSVFQRAHMWLREVYLAREAIRSQYLKYLGLRADGTRIGREASIIAQRLPGVGARARGHMTLTEFRAEVARAQVGFDDVLPEAVEAAKVLDEGFKRIEVEARKQGMFEGQRERSIRAGKKRNLARQYRNDAEAVERSHPDLADDYRASAERLEIEADALDTIAAEKPTMPFREERYYHRMWNTAAIEANRDQLQRILARAYHRENHPNPDAAADAAIDLIMMEPTGTAIHAPGSPSALRHRSIPVTNKEVFDFIVQDPETVAVQYYRRMGAAVEMTREFGDSAGLDELDRLRLDMRRRGIPDDKAQMALQRWLDARDRIAGGLHGSNPLSWGNRAARAARNFTSIYALGRVALSQLLDPLKASLVQGLGLSRVVGREGSAGIIQGLAAAFNGDLHKFNIGGPAKLTGEATELALARAMSRFIEEDDAVLVQQQTRVERWLAQLQAPNSVANLIAPMTTFFKEIVGFTAAHNIIDDARRVSEAVRAGGEPDSAAVKRLSRNGIDVLDAHLLADMPVEMTDNGLIMPNAMAWEGEGGERARRLLLAAVSGEVRRSVITPGPLDRPRWFDGVVVTKGKVRNAFDEMDAANRAYDEARNAVQALRGRAEGDPELLAAQEVLEERRLERFRARRELGRKGRTELPLLSLPAQLHSFAMASGAKTLHGLWTLGERNKAGGLLTMLVGGLLVARLKMSDHQWEGMDWDERIVAAVDNSGLLAVFGDVGKSIDNMLDLQLVPGAERDPEGESINDEAGAIAPAIGSALRMVDVFSDAAQADTMEVWGTLRRLPGFNIIWMQNAIDFIVGTFEGDGTAESERRVLGRDVVGEAPVATVDDMTGRGRVMADPDQLMFAGPAPVAANPELNLLAGQREPDDLETVLARIDPDIAEQIRAKAAKKGRKRKGRAPRIRKPLKQLL